MKCLDKSTDMKLFLNGTTKSIFSPARDSKVSNRLSRFYGVSVSVALGTLLVALVLFPSMRPRGSSVAAFSEGIAVFQGDCETAQTSFTWGDTVCARVTGAPFPDQRRLAFVAPNGLVAQQTAINSDPQSVTFSLDIAVGDQFRQPGTWSIKTLNNDTESVVTTTFVVHDSVPKADLAIIKSGPSAIGAGGNITYTVTVFNRGPDDAPAVTVADPAPAGTTFVSATGPSGPCPSSTCTVATIAANSSGVFTYVYNVNATLPADTIISNTASVSSSVPDPRPIDNIYVFETTVVGTAVAPCTINCGGNLTFVNDPNAANPCVRTVTYTTPTATGNCADPETGVTSPVSCSPPSGSPFPVGNTAVTCTSGAYTCSFQVTVNETRTDPFVLNCPANISVEESFPGSGFATIGYSMPTATTRCVSAVICDPPDGSQFPVGTHTVSCTAKDAFDNTATCSFSVTVTSNVCTPATLCTGDITVRNAIDQCGAIVTFPTPPSGCGTVTCTPESGSFFPVGTTAVTCTSSAVSCGFNVIVQDLQDPTILCPADKTVALPLNTPDTSIAVSYVTATATDNCAGVGTVLCLPPSGSVFPVGTSTVVCTVADAAGNTISCGFDVTVQYNFTGFFSPVNNPPTLNSVNAGRAIPVKFSLSGNKGLNIFAPGFPASGEITCDSSAPPAEVTETLTAGNSSLSYAGGSDQYNYVWKTESAWAGTCRQLIVRLSDGTTHIANFKFK